MSHRVRRAVLGILWLVHAGCGGDSPTDPTREDPVDYRAGLRSTLRTLLDQSSDPLLRLHFGSIPRVVEAGDRRLAADDQGIKELWTAFTNTSTPKSPRLRESYLDRSRPLIVSWVSPTDNQVSFAWLTLPARWDPTMEYPIFASGNELRVRKTATSSRPGVAGTCGTEGSRRRTSGRAGRS